MSKASIVETHPEVARQWHYEKNGNKQPSDFTKGSSIKVWWLCSNGHPPWEAAIFSRTRGNGCPYCTNKKTCIDKSIAVTHPKIAEQWHLTKNEKKIPSDYVSGSNKKLWWLCDKATCEKGCKHEWETTINSRCLQNTGCPYCSGRIVCPCNSIETTHPEIAKQWHPTKNGKDKLPSHYSSGSGELIWWQCENRTCIEGCIHEWEEYIYNRCGRIESGCPYCSKPRKQICIHNSIQNTHPEIAKQWHPTKNGKDKLPSHYSSGSPEKVWWLCANINCKEGCVHEWESTIYSRCTLNTGCIYCCRFKRSVCAHNSIEHTHSEIAKQWHPTKNSQKLPSSYSFGSGEKIWWICANNHDPWLTTIAHRCIDDNRCPSCKYKTEQKLYDYVKKYSSDTIHQPRYDWCKNPITKRVLPFDILVPSLQLILECDGEQHFKQVSNWSSHEFTQLKDCYKMIQAMNQDYHILRIPQEDLINADEAWMDEYVLPELVKKESGITFVAKNLELYDSLHKLYESIDETQLVEKLRACYETGIEDESEEEEESEEPEEPEEPEEEEKEN